MLLKVFWKSLSLREILDLLNQVVNVNAMWSFHDRVRHAWDVEVNVLLIDCKVELVRVWWCSITMSGRTRFLHCVCLLDSTGFPVLSEEPSSSCNRLPTISCEWDVFPFSTKTRSISTGFPVRSQIGLGLDWVGLEDSARGAYLKNCWTSFPTGWLMFNCKPDWSFPLVHVREWVTS